MTSVTDFPSEGMWEICWDCGLDRKWAGTGPLMVRVAAAEGSGSNCSLPPRPHVDYLFFREVWERACCLYAHSRVNCMFVGCVICSCRGGLPCC